MSVRKSKFGVQRRGLPQKSGRVSKRFFAPAFEAYQTGALPVARPGVWFRVAAAPNQGNFRANKFWFNSADNRARDLILYFEDVVGAAVNFFGPELRSGRCVDQLNAHAKLPACRPQTSLHDVPDPK